MGEIGDRSGATGPAGPTRAERLALAGAAAARAAGKGDPLAANLGVLTADLMGFAHALGDQVRATLAAGLGSAEARHRFARDAETYLKFVRQIDRLAQVERQLAPPDAGGPGG